MNIFVNSEIQFVLYYIYRDGLNWNDLQNMFITIKLYKKFSCTIPGVYTSVCTLHDLKLNSCKIFVPSLEYGFSPLSQITVS